MTPPLSILQPGLEDFLRERYPTTSFYLGQNTFSWEDGPSKDEIQLLLSDAGHRELRRSYTALGWALGRGPQFTSTETPWNLEQIHRQLGDIHYDWTAPETLGALNLEDLHEVAGSPQRYIQAEIAVGLGLGSQDSFIVFDLWLEHGGWHHAGLLAQTQDQA